MVWDVIRTSVLCSEFLSFLSSFSKVFSLLAEFLLTRGGIFRESLLHAFSLIVFYIKLVQNLVKGLITNMIHVWLLFRVKFSIPLLFSEALSFIESRVVSTQHAKVRSPVIFTRIVLNFDNPLIHVR